MIDDPRDLPGDIAGPGGPHDENGVVLDIRHAVLLDYATVSLVETRAGGEPGQAVAILLEGRINKSDDRARVLFLTNEDGAAGIVTELLALGSRAANLLPELAPRIEERLRDLACKGHI